MSKSEGYAGELTIDEERALFFSHFTKVLKQSGIVKAASLQLGRLRKEAKADGIKMKAMDLALRCNDIEDDSILVDEFKAAAKVLTWMGVPAIAQSELFPDLTPLADRASDAGALASAKGLPGVSPHSPGSEADQAWLEAFAKDGADRLVSLGDAMRKTASVVAKAKAGPGKSEAERALDGEPGFVGEGLEAPAPEAELKPAKNPRTKTRKQSKAAKVKEAA